MLPDIRRVITTPDGATFLFTMRGRTVWRATAEGVVGNQLLSVLFETEDEGHRWLNDAALRPRGRRGAADAGQADVPERQEACGSMRARNDRRSAVDTHDRARTSADRAGSVLCSGREGAMILIVGAAVVWAGRSPGDCWRRGNQSAP